MLRIPRIASREITDEWLLLHRRAVLRGAVGLAGSAWLGAGPAAAEEAAGPWAPLESVPGPPAFETEEAQTPFKDATRYNNFYEFGTGKEDPARFAGSLRPRPSSVAIDGEVKKPGLVPLEDLLRPHPLEERVYRLRCVEAWSMVIPWVGFPLGDLLRRFEPSSKARYVAFETLVDP